MDMQSYLVLFVGYNYRITQLGQGFFENVIVKALFCIEQLQQYRNSAFDQAVRNGVLQGKVMQFIRFHAIITE